MTALTLGISLSVHLGLIGAQQVIFYIPYVFKFPFPELWRLGTSFFFTSGLGIVLDTYFCELNLSSFVTILRHFPFSPQPPK